MTATSTRTRRMERRQWALGGAATAVVAILMHLGWFDRAEWVTQDWRARWFDRWSPPSSPDITIVGIDDRALREIGGWPWDRGVLGDTVREIGEAGARVVALDILIEEPKPGDELLAGAAAEYGSVVAAARFRRSTAIGGAPDANGAPPLGAVLEVLKNQPALETMDPRTASGVVLRALARATTPDGKAEWATAEVARRIAQARTIRAAEAGSSMPVLRGPRWATVVDIVPPVEPLGRSAAMIADVSADTHDPGGVVRRLPVLVEFRDRLWPTLGLAAAARFMGSSPERWRVERRSGGADVVVPKGAGGNAGGSDPATEKRLPMRAGEVGGAWAEGLCEITWPRGGHTWLGQFGGQNGTREVSIAVVLEPVLIARAVRSNLDQLDKLVEFSKTTNEGEREAFHARSAQLAQFGLDDAGWPGLFQRQEELAARIAAGAKEFLDFAGEPDPATLPPDDARALANYQALARGIPALLEECRAAPRRVGEARARLRELLNGKLCLVGWTATSGVGLADQVNTSIAPQTPGVYIHAAVANSVLTGFWRRPLGAPASLASVLILGLAATAIGSRVRVELGPALVAGLIGGWFLLAGMALWDAAWIVAPVVGPSFAAGGAWLSVMLHRLLVEQRARTRTEERFRSYVSPAVVEILVNNPGLNSMAPQRRELTVMFSDLVGFTAAAERLGAARTAAVLGTYLGAMTESLQAHAATLDKYLGDGIMAFWGAPIENVEHATDACRAVLAMQRALSDLNKAGAFGEAGPLSMRIGLAAGELMVGDFGNPPRNSSYTVLGDASNLASRLESASRQLGTTILTSSRVRTLAGEVFAWRRIGRVTVQGRRQAEEVFELLGEAAGAAGDGRLGARIRLTEEAVTAFGTGDFGHAAALLEKLEREFGEGRLAGVYREAIGRWSKGPGGGARAGFDGTIELTDK